MQLAGEGERRRESLARERMNQLAEKSRNSLTSGLLVRPMGGRGVYIIYILLLLFLSLFSVIDRYLLFILSLLLSSSLSL